MDAALAAHDDRPGQSRRRSGAGYCALRGVPILYLPYFKKSLERMPRKSGFLTPNIGNSSRFGRMLGQAYYWAINRSYDMTVGGNWYTDRGLASNLSFRGRPTKNSSFDAVFFDVRDRAAASSTTAAA